MIPLSLVLSLTTCTLTNFLELLISHADFNYCYYHTSKTTLGTNAIQTVNALICI